MSESSLTGKNASAENSWDRKWIQGLNIAAAVGLAIGVLGLVLGYSDNDAGPWLSWLIGITFWLSILLGSMFLIMISYVFDAGWSIIIRRQLEHLVGGFKWLALLFIPLILLPWLSDKPGLVWKWMDLSAVLHSGHEVGHDPLYQWKAIWLNLPWMTFRTILYFAVFAGVAHLLRKYSFRLELDGDTQWIHRARRMSAIGIFAVALALTFAAFDWFMSLEYHWFSTMFGVWFFASSMRAAVAFVIILCWFLSTRGYLKGIYQQAHRYDLGTLLLAFTIFWAYIAFSQMFLIYQANIPEETFWYNMRLYAEDGSFSGWWYVSMSLALCHFLIPFLFLVFYSTKISLNRLVWVAVWTLLFHSLDLFYNILPGEVMTPDGHWIVRGFGVTVFDIAAWIGVGGLVMGSFLRSSRLVKPIPIRDPRILESIHHHE